LTVRRFSEVFRWSITENSKTARVSALTLVIALILVLGLSYVLVGTFTEDRGDIVRPRSAAAMENSWMARHARGAPSIAPSSPRNRPSINAFLVRPVPSDENDRVDRIQNML
jgi:hypothetical protein